MFDLWTHLLACLYRARLAVQASAKITGPGCARMLTFADEALLGDGLLADVAALSLLEWLQLEGVRVDAL